jgi:geranylgeranyl reductase family protein
MKARIAKRIPSRTSLFYDVIIVGGGPAGSTLAWELARRGITTLLLERARFPREKVCGDYVEPRGLRIIQKMGCLDHLEADSPLPISHSATFVNAQRAYQGRIPFYGVGGDMPPHGYIIPREKLDTVLFEAAAKAGAVALPESGVTGVTVSRSGVTVEVSRGKTSIFYRGRAVVGADGVNSVVARSLELHVSDLRYTAVSQRGYAEGIDGDVGEAVFYFEKDFFPGYGWMFPMRRGKVNVGVGVLSEASRRSGLNIPQLLVEFIQKLKCSHPRCSKLRLCRPPIGGIVRTFGGAGPNYFSRGMLIGDAGSFVDPMTGEGITPAMESGILAASVIGRAFDLGRFDADVFSAYERTFRAYFNPSMIFLDLCAATMRNRHYAEPWLKALARGCEAAQKDPAFARTAGAYFGGLEINPMLVLSQVWFKLAAEWGSVLTKSMQGFLNKQANPLLPLARDMMSWNLSWWASILDDPVWHASWTLDLQQKWVKLLSTVKDFPKDPRADGPLEFTERTDPAAAAGAVG